MTTVASALRWPIGIVSIGSAHGAVRSRHARGLLRAADLPPASDRVLRRAPARVQPQHAREEGARPSGHRRALERLFARGIDPEDEASASRSARRMAVARQVRRFADECDARVLDALANAPLSNPAIRCCTGPGGVRDSRARGDAPGNDALHVASAGVRAKARHRCATDVAGDDASPATVRFRPAARRLAPPGEIRFGWDNEFPGMSSKCPRSRSTSTTSPTSGSSIRRGRRLPSSRVVGARRLRVAPAGGIEHPRFWTRQNGTWQWRGMFEAFLCRPRGRSTSVKRRPRRTRAGRAPPAHRGRIPSRRLRDRRDASGHIPWGARAPDASRGHFDFAAWDPVAVGRHPAGQSAWGVHDLMGNGWEWTSTVFAPFAGFRPMASYPRYSADFFDGQHMVMKGASPVTAPRCCAAASATGSGRTIRTCMPRSAACGRPSRPMKTHTRGGSVIGPRRRGSDRRRSDEQLDFARDAALLSAADPAAAALAFPLRRPRLGSLRRDLPLAWYRITRAELRLLQRHAARDRAAFGRGDRVVELGCGNGEKLATLVRTPAPRVHAHLIDFSEAALARSMQALATSTAGRPRDDPPGDLRGWAARAAGRCGPPTLVAFLGSNIGNFDPPARPSSCT